MEDYISKLLDEALYDMEGIAKTPAACHLFNINDGAKKLPEEKKQLFHHIIAKLLYLCRRTQQDIQTAIAFLCTRVKSPDEDDYKKLARDTQHMTKSFPSTGNVSEVHRSFLGKAEKMMGPKIRRKEKPMTQK